MVNVVDNNKIVSNLWFFVKIIVVINTLLSFVIVCYYIFF